MKILTKDQFQEMPWKNGGGITTELFREPQSGEFNIRLSRARVSRDGPFSSFPQIDRWLVILSGKGIILNDLIELTPSSAPFFFKGEDSISGKLISGEVIDFNVMIRRNYGEAEILFLKEGFYKSENSQSFIFETKGERLIILDQDECFDINSESIIVLLKKGP